MEVVNCNGLSVFFLLRGFSVCTRRCIAAAYTLRAKLLWAYCREKEITLRRSYCGLMAGRKRWAALRPTFFASPSPPVNPNPRPRWTTVRINIRGELQINLLGFLKWTQMEIDRSHFFIFSSYFWHRDNFQEEFERERSGVQLWPVCSKSPPPLLYAYEALRFVGLFMDSVTPGSNWSRCFTNCGLDLCVAGCH